MTEYWVSQGNKWCDFCKIYIANNPLSIRTHELGQRHKDSVAKRLASMRKESAAKEKEQKEAVRAFEQIEAKAKRSYQKDLTAFREVRDSNENKVEAHEEIPETAACSLAPADGWEYDAASGYYYNQANGYHYDPNSGLYFSHSIGGTLNWIPGEWVTQEKAFAVSSSQILGSDDAYVPSEAKDGKGTSLAPQSSAVAEGGDGGKNQQGGPPPGLVVPALSQLPMRTSASYKGVPSSISVIKRKRQDEKPKAVSKEEADARKAREAAKKRMEEREKPLLGLYRSY